MRPTPPLRRCGRGWSASGPDRPPLRPQGHGPARQGRSRSSVQRLRPAERVPALSAAQRWSHPLQICPHPPLHAAAVALALLPRPALRVLCGPVRGSSCQAGGPTGSTPPLQPQTRPCGSSTRHGPVRHGPEQRLRAHRVWRWVEQLAEPHRSKPIPEATEPATPPPPPTEQQSLLQPLGQGLTTAPCRLQHPQWHSPVRTARPAAWLLQALRPILGAVARFLRHRSYQSGRQREK